MWSERTTHTCTGSPKKISLVVPMHESHVSENPARSSVRACSYCTGAELVCGGIEKLSVTNFSLDSVNNRRLPGEG